jgi:hypothetical protein
MSGPRLPAEMLDHVVDLLHDTEDALGNCCLVSKSWVPRTRKHLFADIKFPTPRRLQSWKEMFPDPSTSPAYYAETLSVGCSQVVTAVDAEAGGWIKGFSRVVHVEVGCGELSVGGSLSLVPFRGFSPVVKSLHITVPALSSPRAFDLILSFPLLESLTVSAHYEAPVYKDDGPGKDETSTATQPSSPPMFTGVLKLLLGRGMEYLTRRLLSLPSGIHFRKLTLAWLYEGDLSLIMALVRKCSHTLESLEITGNLGTCILHPRLGRHLTSVSRPPSASPDRPLESDKPRRCDV